MSKSYSLIETYGKYIYQLFLQKKSHRNQRESECWIFIRRIDGMIAII